MAGAPGPRKVFAFDGLRGCGRVFSSQRKTDGQGSKGTDRCPARDRPAAPGAGEGAGPGPDRKEQVVSAGSRPPWEAREPWDLEGTGLYYPAQPRGDRQGHECQHWRSWGHPDTVGGMPETPKVSPQLPQAGPGGELGLMDRPNQVMGQMPQEEVRGQGSEVVHFIDWVLPTSCNLPAKPDPGLCHRPIHWSGERTGVPDIKGLGAAVAGGGRWGRPAVGSRGRG